MMKRYQNGLRTVLRRTPLHWVWLLAQPAPTQDSARAQRAMIMFPKGSRQHIVH